MVWTTPRTWTTGEVVTAAIMNTHVRDNLNFLRAHHGARVFKSTSQTVAGGNTDVVSFNSEDYDTDAAHDNVTNNSRITIPSALDGFWEVIFATDVDADLSNHNGRMSLQVRKNAAGASGSGTQLENKGFDTHANIQSGLITWQGSLVAADHVEAFFFSATETRVLEAATAGTAMTAKYLGS